MAHNLHAGSYLTMRSVEAIVCELTAVNASITKRSKLDSKTSDSLREKAARQIAYAISNLGDVDFQSAQKLYEAINEAGMSDEATTLMNTAVDGKLDSHLEGQSADIAESSKKLGQDLLYPENWAVDELHSFVSDKSKSFNMKLQMCADHLVWCGVTKPSEKTIGAWLSFCVCLHYKALPSYHILKGFISDLKNMIIASHKPSKFPVIMEYPKSPEALPQHVYDEIFKNDYVPIQISVPHMRDVFANHMPLRGNNKLLKSQTKPSVELAGPEDDGPRKGAAATRPRRSSSSSLGSPKLKEEPSSLGSMSPSPVKTEIPAEPTDDFSSPPDWAADLMNMLSGRESKGSTSSLPPPPVEAMAALTDGPDWAKELHRLLEGACNRAADVKPETALKTEHTPEACKDEPTSEHPSRLGHLQKKLRPKGNLSLRMTHMTDEPAPIGTSDAEPRPTMADLEEKAASALKSVAAKRAEAAAARKKEQIEAAAAKKKEKEEQAAASANKKKGQKTSPSAKTKAGDIRRRLTGKQPQPSSACASSKKSPKAKGASKQGVSVRRMKRPAAVYDSANPPECPEPDDETPIEYNSGKIYNRPNAFRVLRNKSDAYTERSFAHKRWTRPEGFLKSLQAIDDYWAEVQRRGEDVE